ncbi:MAG TPA: aspartate/glutamate racemase family protein, partial [Acinetobacter sp.]|nr:aspartate/glutamate racemase family protein [Acinetobacter sp.]
ATPATFRGQLIKDVMHKFAEPAGVRVLPVTSLELVPFIEAGQQMSPACLSALQQILKPVVEQGADYLVLGCTHYPFLKDAIGQIFADKLKLIDSGQAVARQTAYILIKNRLISDKISHNAVRVECYVSGHNAKELRPILQNLISEKLTWTIRNLDEMGA